MILLHYKGGSDKLVGVGGVSDLVRALKTGRWIQTGNPSVLMFTFYELSLRHGMKPTEFAARVSAVSSCRCDSGVV